MAYIDREKAIDEIDKWLDSVGSIIVGKGLTSYGELVGCLEDTPTADVVEVRHGKWEYIGTDKHGNVFRCSNCALRIGLDYETTYCPHCGAKMDLEEENK